MGQDKFIVPIESRLKVNQNVSQANLED
jgi:hypothetical protein